MGGGGVGGCVIMLIYSKAQTNSRGNSRENRLSQFESKKNFFFVYSRRGFKPLLCHLNENFLVQIVVSQPIL